MQVFADEKTGKVNGWCYSCSTFVANPYGEEKTVDDVELPKPKTPEEIEEEIKEIDSYPTVDLPMRKLRGKELEEFGVKTALSEVDGKTPTHAYFPITKKGKVTGYYIKTQSDPSHQWSVGDVIDGDLFNWENAKKSGAYRLVVAEGREDAVALDKIYKRYGDPKYHPAIVSLPNGTGKAGDVLTKHREEIRRLFKEVVLVYDDDESGDEALIKSMLVLPEAKAVKLQGGDPNECVKSGTMKAAYNTLSFQTYVPKNSRLVIGSSLHGEARTPTPWGALNWPWPTFNDFLRGIRYGETIYIGAGVKMGKSQLVDDLTSFFIKDEGVNVFLAKPEEANKKTYKKVCGKMVGSVFDDPKIEFDYEAFDRAGKMLEGDKLVMVDLYQHIGWETLKDDILAAINLGCKVIMIDPITNLTAGMPSSEANTHLEKVTRELSQMAMDHDVVMFIFCHLKAPEGNLGKDQRRKKYAEGQYIGLGNCPHEQGGDVLSTQFAGSRSMMRACNLMIGLEGNRDKELPEGVRNIRNLTILEDREFGNSESVPLFWNKNTTKFKEI